MSAQFPSTPRAAVYLMSQSAESIVFVESSLVKKAKELLQNANHWESLIDLTLGNRIVSEVEEVTSQTLEKYYVVSDDSIAQADKFKFTIFSEKGTIYRDYVDGSMASVIDKIHKVVEVPLASSLVFITRQ